MVYKAPSSNSEHSQFKTRVLEAIQLVPYGTVASYGQIALLVGAPRAARQVGWILNKSEGENLPWWRIVNNTGRVSIKGAKYSDRELQRKLLRAEGVDVAEDMTFSIEEYRFKPSLLQLKQLALPEKYLEELIVRYAL